MGVKFWVLVTVQPTEGEPNRGGVKKMKKILQGGKLKMLWGLGGTA